MSFKGTLAAAFLLTCLFIVACGSEATPTPTQPPPTPTPGSAAPAAPTPTAMTPSEPTATPAPGAPTPTPVPPTPTPTLAPTPTPPPSFDAEAHFRGKTIRLIVGFNPGGGTDTQARFLAANLGKFIPGNPRIVVSNHTPQMAASNFVWKSEPDGTVLQYTAGTLITNSFEPEAEFTASGFGLIGAPQGGNPFWAHRGTLPYTDIRDAIGKPDGEPLVQTGPGSAPEATGVVLGGMMVADWLNLPIDYRVVAGTGTEQTLLMLERGDVNALLIAPGSSWYTLPARRPGWFADGFLKPFASMLVPGQEIHPNAEIEFTAPHARDLLEPDQASLFNSLTSPQHVALKHFAGPPGMDPAVLATLRKAWDDAIADPEFNADFSRVLGTDVASVQGARLEQIYTATVDGYREHLGTLGDLQERLFKKFIE